MSKVTLVAKVNAKPGKRDELVAAMDQIVKLTKVEEPRTEVFSVFADEDDLNAIWVIEVYADAEAKAAHGTAPAIKALHPGLYELLDGPLELHKGPLLFGKGIDA